MAMKFGLKDPEIDDYKIEVEVIEMIDLWLIVDSWDS
jgi:hypothetical protein